jgi:hypothetical protein
MLVPIAVLKYAYYTIAGSFAFVALCALCEIITAIFSTKFASRPMKQTKEKWPEVTYMVPAYLGNEAGILGQTIQHYLDLDYDGEINIMIVFNSTASLPKAEAALYDTWDGMRIGRKSFQVVKNAWCDPYMLMVPIWACFA